MEASDPLSQPTQNTQGVMDPRRMGRNNSGLTPADVSDVMCILHPSTPAAFNLVAETARRDPQHILQDVYEHRTNHAAGQSMLEEEETFILDGNGSNEALDLALRFSSPLRRAELGFLFGRNLKECDITVSSDVHKRVSNVHFCIYMNESGVIMLKDMSTNGTMVDDVLLRGRSSEGPKQRMLNHGSIVQILSPSPKEALKFIVRIPSRTGASDEYEIKFREYVERQAAAAARAHDDGKNLLIAPRVQTGQPRQATTSVKAPIVHNPYGMNWNGGEKFNVVGQIGKGAFASVYQLATKAEGHLFAAKELEKRKFMKNGILDRKLENEMHIMQQINHTSIVQYHGFQDVANHLYIIMEYVPGGDLQQYLTEMGPLPERVAQQVGHQVFDALDYLHHKRITHRDIKPDNILISSRDPQNFVIKLSDFGLSKVVKDNDTFLKTFCGTLLYCAPEVFPHYDAHVSAKGVKRSRRPPPQQASKKFHSYSQAVDIWSFGAVLWYSLCHKPPFEGVADNTGRGMFDKIMMTPLDAADLVRAEVSDEAVALLVSMLNTDPAARPSAEDCLRHEWFGERPAPPKRLSQPVNHLEDIEEEGEADIGADEDRNTADGTGLAALSLHERAVGRQDSELSINSSDLDFFDPRKSKRFKSMHVGEQEIDDFFDSSPELPDDAAPIMRSEDEQQQRQDAAEQSKPPKLFGEISQSNLPQPPFDPRTNQAVDWGANSLQSEDDARISTGSSQKAQQDSSGEFPVAASLFGAESMVREMNMDSNMDSEEDEKEEPDTPDSKHDIDDVSQHTPPSREAHAQEGPTPRAQRRTPFTRQMHIPLPPSFYYDPHDPSTHTLEYASKVSGRDYVAEYKDQANGTAPPRRSRPNSARGSGDNITNQNGTLEAHNRKDANATTNGSPRLLGRLVSTPDSFQHIVLDMNSRDISWGRGEHNTYVHAKTSDTLVPRTALLVFFHAGGIEKVPADGDITHLEGLYTGILTHGSNGLRINGVQLDKGELGKYLYGLIHTGDQIEVFPDTKDGKRGLWFDVEIYYGKGKTPRSKHGPRFKVEQERRASQEGRKKDQADDEHIGSQNQPKEVVV